jgi:ASC-1-like (ASCH) protein
MKIYRNHRFEPWFGYLKSGQKTIEGRIKRGKYARIKAGDQIEVNNENESEKVLVEVIRMKNYPTFKDMLAREPIGRLLPGVSGIDEGLSIYREFYSQDEEIKFGVVAIEVKLLS